MSPTSSRPQAGKRVRREAAGEAVGYAELHCHSCFSLLDGTALPEALVARAKELGLAALALTDHDELGGAVRFATAAHDEKFTCLTGAELTLTIDARGGAGAAAPLVTHLPLLAESREGYGNLSTLVTLARRDPSRRGKPSISLEQLAAHAGGLFALTGSPRGWVPTLAARGETGAARDAAATLREMFHGRIAVECWDHGLPEERDTTQRLIAIARTLGVPWVVTNDVHYLWARDRMVHDALTALRHQQTLDQMGTRLRPNGEWYLKSAAQIAQRWRGNLEGVRATLEIAERCKFRLTELRPSLPPYPSPPGVSADEHLRELAMQGADERWGPPGTAKRTAAHDAQLELELALIGRRKLAGYFLIVSDIMQFARHHKILCQGRGSAVNSAVCYCLGITPVDPIELGLLFARFLSDHRESMPDIDIDFAHRERERVIQYVYDKYGRDHAAMVCEQITYRGRSAVRDAARVLGFSVEQGDTLAALSDRFSAKATADALRAAPANDEASDTAFAEALGGGKVSVTEATYHSRTGDEQTKHSAARRGSRWEDPYAPGDHTERRNPTTALRPTDGASVIERAGFDPEDRRVRALADVVEGLHQIPRHRSIHVGGFVLTAEPLCTVVPIEPASMPGRTVIQWEKDDLDPVGLVKIDLLGLGMLTLLQDCLLYIEQQRGVTIDLAKLDTKDQAVYDDLCAADTIGLFQVESRAQMNTLPRLRPRKFYDLVIEVAIIRPGPIQGDMVHPYLRRRSGEEDVTYLHPSLEPILERTLGVPLFQEQGMQVAITAAGFTAVEADELRRAMGHKRSREKMAAIRERMLDGMAKNGIPRADADRIFNQINGFADYGFPESHAASFALLVYASAYLKHHYAPEFTAAILNAQPMGFYAPGTLVEDARRHGVEVRPADLTRSRWEATLEPRTAPADAKAAPAVRLGIRSVRGLGSAARDKLERALAEGPFRSIDEVVRRTKLDQRALRHLAEAGTLDAFLPHEPELAKRRAALWAVLDAARGDAGPLAPRPRRAARPAPLPPMSPVELTEADYRMTGISLAGHPMSHIRSVLVPNGVRSAHDLQQHGRDGEVVATAGLVICRQRPGTAKGFVFLTLEDETGLINVVVTPQRFERQALLISRSPLLLVRGVLQVEQRVVNVRAREFRALQADVGAEFAQRHDYH